MILLSRGATVLQHSTVCPEARYMQNSKSRPREFPSNRKRMSVRKTRYVRFWTYSYSAQGSVSLDAVSTTPTFIPPKSCSGTANLSGLAVRHSRDPATAAALLGLSAVRRYCGTDAESERKWRKGHPIMHGGAEARHCTSPLFTNTEGREADLEYPIINGFY